MAVYAVSYDLHKKGEISYENLIDAIKGFGTWCHYLESDWMVVSSSTAAQIRDTLKPHIHKDDKLIVIRLGDEAAWWNLSDKISNWIRVNLK